MPIATHDNTAITLSNDGIGRKRPQNLKKTGLRFLHEAMQHNIENGLTTILEGITLPV